LTPSLGVALLGLSLLTLESLAEEVVDCEALNIWQINIFLSLELLKFIEIYFMGYKDMFCYPELVFKECKMYAIWQNTNLKKKLLYYFYVENKILLVLQVKYKKIHSFKHIPTLLGQLTIFNSD
jgi:hypothetical protein